MDDIAKYRSEFLIFIIEKDPTLRGNLQNALTAANFQVQSFSTESDVLQKIKESPPHIVVGSESLILLPQIRALSSDIEVVGMVSPLQRHLGVDGLQKGAFAFLERSASPQEIVVVLDRTVERIYRRMENEQLLEELARKSKTSEPSGTSELLFDRVLGEEDPDRVLEILVQELSHNIRNLPVIFLKFFPARHSLVAKAAAQIPIEKIKNLGIKLDKYDVKEIYEFMANPQGLAEVKEMMHEVFNCHSYFVLPLSGENGPEGLIILFSSLDEQKRAFVRSTLSFFNFAFSRATLAQTVKELSTKDATTGLFNRKYLNEKIEEEISRSGRTRFPLSLICLDIDDFKSYNDLQGHLLGDIILRSVGQILTKTSRKTDIIFRVGGGEFAVLCSATPAVGAAIKSEKIRLTVEGTRFPYGEKQPGGKVTVSIGVSEYPTRAADSQTLVRSAEDALYQVKQGGKNRVCLSEAPMNFKPDFEPVAVPDTRPVPQSIPKTV